MPSTATLERQPIALPTKRFLNEAEVESSYGVPQKTLRNWRVFGKGPPYRKFGVSVRYDVRDLEEWIASLPLGGAGVPASALKTRRK